MNSLTGVLFWMSGAGWLLASRSPTNRWGQWWWGNDIGQRSSDDIRRIVRRGTWAGGSMLLLAVAMAFSDLRFVYRDQATMITMGQWLFMGLGGVGMLIGISRPAPTGTSSPHESADAE